MKMMLYAIVAAMAGAAAAAIKTETVRYKVGEQEFIGYLAYDDAAQGPQPAVIIVHAWWGLDDFAKQKARDVAELGYVAFALDMYGGGEHTNDPERARALAYGVLGEPEKAVRRWEAAFETVVQDKRVDRDRVAAMGYCFGGLNVLLMAQHGLPLVGVVSFHGSMPDPQTADFSRCKAKLMIQHGRADTLVPNEQVEAYVAAAEKAGVDWQLVVHHNAKHSFTNPAADRLGMDGVGYDEKANRRSWAQTRAFFEELFAQAD